jgi:septum site-determining protein MinC
MSVALAGRAPATFEIKSATLPLVSLLLKSPDLQALAGELQARFGDIPDFFDHDPLVVDLTHLSQDATVDFAALVQLLRPYKVMPVAVRGGQAALMAQAREAGLAWAEDLAPGLRQAQPERVAESRRPEPARAEPASTPRERAPVRPERPSVRPDPAPVRPEPVEGQPPVGALLIDRPLRSGQQVYARGRDLVVMAMVNAGAEVIADGSIHVYAPLRGKAIAGARGNAEARIVSLCLEPELVSIAGIYRTSDVPLPAEVLSQPTQVRLEGGAQGRLVMERLPG